MSQDDRLTGLVGYSGMKVPVDACSSTNLTLSGEQTVDGVLTSGSRVLVNGQTDQTENGIYVTDTGAWSRATDCDGPYDLRQGSTVYAYAGTANRGFWYCTTANTVDIGTDNIVFATASTYLAVVSAFMQTVLDDTTASAARSTLGAAGTASPTFTGQSSFPDGTAAAPSVRVGDEQNGIYSPAANQLALAVAGAFVARIGAAGISIGRDGTPASPLDLKAEASAGYAMTVIGRTADDIGRIRFVNNGYSAEIALIAASSTGTLTFHTGSGTTSRLAIDNNGAIQTGAATAATGYTAAGDITLPAAGKARALNTAKAWCYFTISGGTVSLQSGGFNVTSITDGGVGDYTVNITNAMANVNYAAAIGGPGITNGTTVCFPSEKDAGTRTVSALQLNTAAIGGAVDSPRVSVSIFGN